MALAATALLALSLAQERTPVPPLEPPPDPAAEWRASVEFSLRGGAQEAYSRLLAMDDATPVAWSVLAEALEERGEPLLAAYAFRRAKRPDDAWRTAGPRARETIDADGWAETGGASELLLDLRWLAGERAAPLLLEAFGLRLEARRAGGSVRVGDLRLVTAQALADAGRTAEAVDLLEPYLRDWSDGDGGFARYRALLSLGYGVSATTGDRADRWGTHPSLRLFARLDPAGAEAFLRRVLERHPESRGPRSVLGGLLLSAGRDDEADILLAEAAEREIDLRDLPAEDWARYAPRVVDEHRESLPDLERLIEVVVEAEAWDAAEPLYEALLGQVAEGRYNGIVFDVPRALLDARPDLLEGLVERIREAESTNPHLRYSNGVLAWRLGLRGAALSEWRRCVTLGDVHGAGARALLGAAQGYTMRF